jgi:hypothetical protein
MAYIYGKTGHAAITRADRRKDLLLRMGLPLTFLLVLAAVGAYAFLHGHYLITTLFIIAFVISLLRFDELGLTFVHHLSQAETSARSDQVVAKMLRLLPNEYHVFHDLRFYKMHIDHAVLGPNGFFLIEVKRHLGAVTLSKDSLRLNGWPFLRDLFGQSWKKAQALTKHLGLQLTAGIELTPVLCFSRGHVGFTRIVRGARVVQAASLVPTILAHEASIPAERLARLAEKLAGLVWVKSETIEFTQADIGTPQPVPEVGVGQVCPKCRHQASAMEMEFFPDECPRCGRVYATGPANPPAQTGPAPRTMWRPTMPQLVIAVLAIAGTAGLLVFWSGIFSPSPTVQDTPRIPDVNATVTADQALPAAPTNASLPVPEAAREVESESMNQTAPAQAEGSVIAQGTPAIPAPDQQTNSSSNATALSVTTTQANATAATEAAPPATAPQTNATPQANASAVTAPANATRTTARQQPTNQTETSATGTLTITASKQPVTLWFTDQHTYNRIGPFEVGAKTTKTIVLPKGLYDVVYVENGRRKRTSISFLSDKGRLDF